MMMIRQDTMMMSTLARVAVESSLVMVMDDEGSGHLLDAMRMAESME